MATTGVHSPIRRSSISFVRRRGRPAFPSGSITPHEIVERCLYAMINEGARVLDDGIALRASDLDVIYVNGYGFPAWRGGPMFYADRVGLATVLTRVNAFHRRVRGPVVAGTAARTTGSRRAHVPRSRPQPARAADMTPRILSPDLAIRSGHGGRAVLSAPRSPLGDVPDPPHGLSRSMGRARAGPAVSQRAGRGDRRLAIA